MRRHCNAGPDELARWPAFYIDLLAAGIEAEFPPQSPGGQPLLADDPADDPDAFALPPPHLTS